jgi:hypothetical protein
MTPHEPRPRADAVTVPPRLSSVFALPLIVLACSFAACGRIPGQFEIVQNQAPHPGCVIDTSSTVYRGDGTLDLALVQSGSESAYFVFPLLRNNLPGSSGGPDPNRITMHSFAVDIGSSPYGSMPDGVRNLFGSLEQGGSSSSDYALLHYSLPWSASVDSGGGLTATIVSGFPVDLAQRVRATGSVGQARTSMVVNAHVRAFGSTATQDIESDPLDFPIFVCDGCLIGTVLTCPFPSPPANAGNPCNVSQDSFVDCCSLNGNLVCPPIVSGAQ